MNYAEGQSGLGEQSCLISNHNGFLDVNSILYQNVLLGGMRLKKQVRGSERPSNDNLEACLWHDMEGAFQTKALVIHLGNVEKIKQK